MTDFVGGGLAGVGVSEFNCRSHRLRAPNPVRTDRMPRDLDTLSRHPLKRYAWCFLPLRFPPRPQASGKSPQFPTRESTPSQKICVVFFAPPIPTTSAGIWKIPSISDPRFAVGQPCVVFFAPPIPTTS